MMFRDELSVSEDEFTAADSPVESNGRAPLDAPAVAQQIAFCLNSRPIKKAVRLGPRGQPCQHLLIR